MKDIGFDYAYNYKATAVEAALKEAAPSGVHCYFDNVGGQMSIDVLKQMVPRSIKICLGK